MNSITPKPPLLRIPIELRRMIYDLLLPLRFLPNKWNCGRGKGILLISGMSEKSPAQLTFLGREGRPPTHQTGFLSLRGVNQQLYDETSALLIINPLNLRIVDDLAFTRSSEAVVLSFLRQPWIRENVVHVELYIAYDGLRFTYPLPSDQQPYVLRQYPSRYGTFWSHLINRWFSQSVNVKETHNLQHLAKVLSTFPKLNTVTLMTDCEKLFSIWSDPLGDAEAFRPLLKRGIIVSFQFPQFSSTERVMVYRRAFDAMLRQKSPRSTWWTEAPRENMTWESEGDYSRRNTFPK
jgi:hypothetical protein